jgi:hypothetical protein
MRFGRKFWGFLIILIAAGIARHFSKNGLTDQDVYLLIGLYGTFAFGNVANTLAALKSGGNSSNGSPAPAALSADVEARFTRLEQTSSAILGGVQLQNEALGALLQANAPRSPRAVEQFDSGAPVAPNPELAAQAKANRAAISKYVQ